MVFSDMPLQFRLWESLDAGGIPVVVKHSVYNSLPKDSPIVWVDDIKVTYNTTSSKMLIQMIQDVKKVVQRLRELPPDELDRLQRRVVSWWYDYNKSLQLRIATTINSVMAKR